MTDTSTFCFQASVPLPTTTDPHFNFPQTIQKLSTVLGLVWILLSAAAYCQVQQGKGLHQETPDAEVENGGEPVEIDGRPVMLVYARIGGFTAKERAEAIQRRIVSISKTRTIPIESIHSESRATWTEILAGNERIMGITDADAQGAERDRAQLAAEYTEIIRQVVKQYRDDHTLRRLL